MKFLMLRGQVPQDRDPSEIIFDNIFEVDDVWTVLFYSMLGTDDYGELWYWGGDRKKQFDVNFVERWVPTFADYSLRYINCKTPTIEPDVIFCRGGFKEYHSILERFPKSIKIYYGASRRFLPQPGFSDYDIVLQDSPEQLKICKKRFPDLFSTLFIKPAADTVFYHMPKAEKEYDVCFPANGSQPFKGHKFVYSTVPKDLKLLNLGNNPRNYKYHDNVMSYRVIRSEMVRHISKCKVGIVTVSGEIDSCPRVIPELLACGLPIIVLDDVRFWKEKYVVSGVTGEFATRKNFWDVVKHVLNNIDKYNPRKYYEENLSIIHAAEYLRRKIDEVSV